VSYSLERRRNGVFVTLKISDLFVPTLSHCSCTADITFLGPLSNTHRTSSGSTSCTSMIRLYPVMILLVPTFLWVFVFFVCVAPGRRVETMNHAAMTRNLSSSDSSSRSGTSSMRYTDASLTDEDFPSIRFQCGRGKTPRNIRGETRIPTTHGNGPP